MITKMKKYTFLVFHKEYEAFLEQLREAGVVHVSEKATGAAEDPKLQELLQKQKELQHVMEQGAPDQLVQERQDIEKRVAETEKEAELASVWGTFSVEKIQALEKAGYQLRFFTCPKDKFQEEWGIDIAEKGGRIYFVGVNVPAEIEGCEPVELKKSAADLMKDVEGLRGLLAAADARVEAWQLANRETLEQQIKDAQQQIDWRRVVLNTDHAAEDALCLLEGYCPVDRCPALNDVLDAQHIYYQAVDPIVTDPTPTELNNNKFAKLFEVFTGMYGWPTYGEFDPTPILAPFYLLFFAMCMGDAGYGIALTAFGLLTYYKKVNISMFEGLGPIITVLGIGTFVVGLFLGTFFGITLLDAAWYPDALKSLIISGEVAGFDVQMVLAIGIGVFHICLAMIVKALCYTKRFGLAETISTWGWVLLVVGGVIVAAVSMLLELPTETTKWIIICIGAISALAIFIFNKPGRNPLINIGAGLWDTYGMATGLLGDVLSYVRLYALGLAGGMLGGAFNTIALMVLGENATWQWLPFLLILLFGHVLNILMSALGAFVHPLRLTFVEYFKNSGYEGKGELYQPFAKQMK